MRISIYFLFICSIFLKFYNANAQESKIKFGGYLDTYYAYDFSKPLNDRLYVTQYSKQNEFTLNHGILSAQYDDGKVRANLGLHAGTYPATNYAAEPEQFYKMIYRAYAGYKITKNGWLDIGVFGGHFGYESTLGLERELYSPALATEYTPYYESGIRYTQQVSEKTQVRAVLLNGWQNIGETNQKKSVGIAVDHQFSDKISISYGNYYGDESTNPDKKAMRFHNNFILNTKALDKLSFVGIVDYTIQSNVNANALFLTFISKYDLAEKWSVAGRYENVSDKDGILISGITGSFEMNVYSLALNHYMTENAAFKVEGKLYKGPYKNFQGDLGVGDGSIVLSTGFMIKI